MCYVFSMSGGKSNDSLPCVSSENCVSQLFGNCFFPQQFFFGLMGFTSAWTHSYSKTQRLDADFWSFFSMQLSPLHTVSCKFSPLCLLILVYVSSTQWDIWPLYGFPLLILWSGNCVKQKYGGDLAFNIVCFHSLSHYNLCCLLFKCKSCSYILW